MADDKEGRSTPSFFDRVSNFATPRKPSKASVSSLQPSSLLPRTDFYYYRGFIKNIKQGLGQVTKKRRMLLVKPLRVEILNEKDEADIMEIMLSDIATIRMEEKFNSIALKGKGTLEKSFVFQIDIDGNEDTLANAGMPSSSDYNEKQINEENLKVLLLITGLRLKHFPYLFPCITPQFRDETLSFLFCERYTGGIIKREGEEWFYDAKKKLVISDIGVETKFVFSWDGAKLLPQDKVSSRLGNGLWDGFQLIWHPGEDSEGFLSHNTVKETEMPHSIQRSRSKTTSFSRSESVQPGSAGFEGGLVALAAHGASGTDLSLDCDRPKPKLEKNHSTDLMAVDGEDDELDIKPRHSTGNTSKRVKPKKRDLKSTDHSTVRSTGQKLLSHTKALPSEGPRILAFEWNSSCMKYQYEEDEQEQYSWQWTRHFLKRLNGEGEWIVEGSVPDPVVMFLQIMRYVRHVEPFSV